MPQKPKPYRRHLNSANDLVTTYEEVRAGFVALALERNRRSTPYVAEARALKAAAAQATTPTDLLTIPNLKPALLTAAGVSDKAKKHLQDADKVTVIQELLEKYLEPAGATFVEELVFRFLLTRGDTLGGSMRNIGGFMAQRKLTRAMIASLALAGIQPRWLPSSGKKSWHPVRVDNTDIEVQLRGLSWSKQGHHRTVIYNLQVPLIKKNVDLCLFDCEPTDLDTAKKVPDRYIALGELKGGIDPAGADEHWKTANSALTRIRNAFTKKGQYPKLFFVGAAIQNSMASEIWTQLDEGTLSNAANLTGSNQVASLCNWLTSL